MNYLINFNEHNNSMTVKEYFDAKIKPYIYEILEIPLSDKRISIETKLYSDDYGDDHLIIWLKPLKQKLFHFNNIKDEVNHFISQTKEEIGMKLHVAEYRNFKGYMQEFFDTQPNRWGVYQSDYDIFDIQDWGSTEVKEVALDFIF